ncbi:MAG TPA: nuclease-related domain-containing protein, partial [Ktedonobacteraceae bacterium]|nr:nuclease-related domain-containing protein [Ktedonobacteraceae bacterium]
MTLIHRPCAPNSNAGEQVTRNFLMQQLADTDGILLTNYHLPSGNSTLENDLVLFNERGVWILEVKN